MPFIEALGQFSYRVGKNISSATLVDTVKSSSFFLYIVLVDLFYSILLISGPGNFCLIHVSLVPVLNVVGEQVTYYTVPFFLFF